MLDFLESDGMTLNLVVWSIYIGITIAGFLTVYYKIYLGAFVRALLENEAYTEESAMTLSELGLEKKPLLKREISKNGVFRSLVYRSGDEVVINGNTALPVYRRKTDFENDRFYIPYELRIRASMRFEKRGTHIVLAVLSAVFFLVVAIVITQYADTIINFCKGLIQG